MLKNRLMQMSFQIFFYLLPIVASTYAHSDYRVYELEIINHENKSIRVVNTTWDHIQYQTYVPIAPKEVIYYRRSWMCYQNGSHFKKDCFLSPYTLQSSFLNNENPLSPESNPSLEQN